MEQGKIYRVNKTGLANLFGYNHYFIYLDIYESDNTFLGVMLTHSKKIKTFKNISLNASHFKETDENGNTYNFQYNTTHFVPVKLIKESVLPIGAVEGELSEEGLAFVLNHIKDLSPEPFIEVYNRVFNV
jgi:hypothetical protein